MTLTELIEQLTLTLKDHPEAADCPVRSADTGLEAFAVQVRYDKQTLRGITDMDNYVEIEWCRPWVKDIGKS